jgi:hypothetical protein
MKSILIAAALGLSAITFSAGAYAKTFTVKSWCPKTGASGIGRAATYEAAREKAVNECLKKGGLMICCPNYVREL